MAKEFPTLTSCVLDLKADDYRHAAHLLQRTESTIVVQRVVKRFAELHPTQFVGTIHDSIVVHAEHARTVAKLLRMEFGKLDIKPTITRDKLKRTT